MRFNIGVIDARKPEEQIAISGQRLAIDRWNAAIHTPRVTDIFIAQLKTGLPQFRAQNRIDGIAFTPKSIAMVVELFVIGIEAQAGYIPNRNIGI